MDQQQVDFIAVHLPSIDFISRDFGVPTLLRAIESAMETGKTLSTLTSTDLTRALFAIRAEPLEQPFQCLQDALDFHLRVAPLIGSEFKLEEGEIDVDYE